MSRMTGAPAPDVRDRLAAVWGRTRRLARRALTPGRDARALDEELRFHLECAAAEYRAAGLSSGRAWQRALADFGDVEQVRAEVRQRGAGRWLDDLRRDLRHATRGARRELGFTVTAVATLAIGAAAVAVGLTLVEAARRSPLPYPDAAALVQLSVVTTTGRTTGGGAPTAAGAVQRWRWSYPELAWLRRALAPAPVSPASARRSPAGEAALGPIASSHATQVNVAAAARGDAGAFPERVGAEFVSASYLATLAVAPVAGRGFRADEDDARTAGTAPVALVGDALARRRFGSAAGALGGTLRVNGVPVTVVGVLPPRFGGVSGRATLWLPQAMGGRVLYAGFHTSSESFLTAFARLRLTRDGRATGTAAWTASTGAGRARAMARTRAAVGPLGARLTAALPEAAVARSGEDGVAPPLAVEVRPLRAAYDAPERRRGVLLLVGGVAGVLGIVGVNLAALHLARGTARAREFALRGALGASPTRLVRQVLAEGLGLGAAATLLGLTLAVGAVAVLGAVPAASGLGAVEGLVEGSGDLQFGTWHGPGLLPVLADAGAPGAWAVAAARQVLGTPLVVLGTAGAAAAVALVAALLEARLAGRAVRRAPAGMLRAGGAGAGAAGAAIGSGRAGRRPSPFDVIAVAQLAIAALLVVGAGLLLRSYAQVAARPLGFDPRGVLTFWVAPADPSGSTVVGAARAARLLDRLADVPGVAAASVARCTPLMTTCSSTWAHPIGGSPDVGSRGAWSRGAPTADPPVPGGGASGAAGLLVGRHDVGPAHFRVLGLPLLAGRAFGPADRPGAPKVVIVSATAARRLWPGIAPRDVPGRRLVLGDPAWAAVPDSTAEVVGVAADVTYGAAESPPGAEVYAPALQRAFAETMVLVRVDAAYRAAPGALLPAIRAALQADDPDAPLVDVVPLEVRVARALAARRLLLAALGALTAVALLLAAVGVGGVVAYGVARRRAELGVRLALGARPRQVFVLVLRQGVRFAVLGGVLGVGAALGTTRLLGAMLYGVSATDLPTLVGAVTVLVATALAATAGPAWRAARVDPVRVLRADA